MFPIHLFCVLFLLPEQPNEPLEAQPSSSVQAKETFGKEAVAGVEGDAQGKGSGGQTEQVS